MIAKLSPRSPPVRAWGPCSLVVLCVLPRTGWARGRCGRRAAGWRPWSGRRWRRRGGRRGGQVCAAGGHSGYARCATPCCGAPSFAWNAQGGAAGAGGAVSARRVTCASVPLIVQPQSERAVSAGSSARKNSWPLCLHARGPHAGHTQTLAYASQCVTAERVSTGVCVHHARVSWIPKQPGIICPSPAKATCAHSCPFCVRPTLRRRCRSAMSAGACVWSTVEHAQATSEKAAKADVGTFSMAAATQRVAVAASALACPLGPS